MHEVDDNVGLYEVIRGGLSRLPQGLNAILISRNDPPPTFSRMLANQEMTVLGWEELRLTQEESAEIIRRRSPEPPSVEDLLHLHRAADGWAAGLVLILEWVRREKVTPQAVQKARPERILAYFGEEIFGRVDQPTREFLLKTALLPRMTAGMAEALSGLPVAANILSRLSSQNTFTERRLHHEPVYQYHALFREFLLSRGRRSFAPDELAARTRVAEIELDLAPAERVALETADAAFLLNAPTLYRQVSEVATREAVRKEAGARPSHWWWHLDTLTRVPVA